MSKLGHWWDPFIQSKAFASLKFTEELCVMTMKNDEKFGEEMTCSFRIDMRNLTIFDRALESLKNVHFNGLDLKKVYNV